MASARQLQVAEVLGARRRQVERQAAFVEFEARVAACESGEALDWLVSVRLAGGGRRALPAAVLPGRELFVGLRHRFRLAGIYPWKVAWLRCVDFESDGWLVIGPLEHAWPGCLDWLWLLYEERADGRNLESERDVAEVVFTRAVFELIEQGRLAV